MTVSVETLLYQKSVLVSTIEYLRTGQRPSSEKIERYIGALDDVITYIDEHTEHMTDAERYIDNVGAEQVRQEILSDLRIHADECESAPLANIETETIPTAELIATYQHHMNVYHSS